MRRFPHARREEFSHAVARLDLADGLSVVDAPSGGGYLLDHVGQRIKLTCVETAEAFARQASCDHRHQTLLCGSLDDIPLDSGSADRVLSLAGTHHLPSKPAFYKECARLLPPGGVFCLADVAEDSKAGEFLNSFVDEHSSTGHQGEFLNDQAAGELEQAGFHLDRIEHVGFTWNFHDRHEMATYCALLFGLDRADQATIDDGIRSILGVEEGPTGCRMNWSLLYVKAVRA